MKLSRFMKIVLLTVTAILHVNNCYSQIVIKGIVFEAETRDPLPGAFIYAFHDNKIIKHSICDETGTFTIESDQDNQIDKITVSFVGFKSATITVPGNTGTLEVIMVPQKAQLKNAIVTASVMESHSDTLSYYASAFSDGTERNIGDLISKLPGLAVTKSGGITYQGVAINKFYVEGMDLMSSNYGVITKNLSADKIAKVEVLKNHQPKRVLVGIKDSDRSAVNIVLKENAKNTLMFTGDAVFGGPDHLLFDTKLMMTSFSASQQSLFLAKGNNTGQNIITEIASQQYFGRTGAVLVSDNNLDSDFQSRLNPKRTTLPIPQEYWHNNLSGVSSFNHLKKIQDDLQLRAALHLAGERYSEESSTIEEIHLGDSESLRIEENNKMNDNKYYYLGNISIEKNSSSKYINNTLSFSGQVRHNEGALDKTGNTKEQSYELPSMKIENNLDVTLRTGKASAIEIKSLTKYIHNNHSATFRTGGMEYDQILDDCSIVSHNNASTSLRLGKVMFNVGAVMNIDCQSFDASLEEIDGLDLQRSSNSRYLNMSPGLSATGSYRYRRSILNVSVPLTLNCLSGEINANYLAFRPSASFESNLSSMWKLTAGASYSQYGSSLDQMLPAAVMSNYRTISVSEGLTIRYDKSADLALNYSNDPSFTYATLSGTYHGSGRDKSTIHNYTKDWTVSSYIALPSSSEDFGIHGSLTQYFGIKVFVIKLRGGFTRYNQDLWLNDLYKKYITDQYDASAVLRIAPVSWLSFESETSLVYNSVTGDTNTTHRTVSSSATMSLKPTKFLSLNASSYWQKDNVSYSSIANNPLIRIDASWAFKNFTLTAECRNILNNKEYHRSYISTFNTTTYTVSMPGTQFLIGCRMSI